MRLEIKGTDFREAAFSLPTFGKYIPQRLSCNDNKMQGRSRKKGTDRLGFRGGEDDRDNQAVLFVEECFPGMVITSTLAYGAGCVILLRNRVQVCFAHACTCTIVPTPVVGEAREPQRIIITPCRSHLYVAKTIRFPASSHA
jgi:hypothetical protein